MTDAVTVSQLQTGLSTGFSQSQADTLYYKNTVPINQITLASDNLNLNTKKIINLADGTLANDVVNLSQLQS